MRVIFIDGVNKKMTKEATPTNWRYYLNGLKDLRQLIM